MGARPESDGRHDRPGPEAVPAAGQGPQLRGDAVVPLGFLLDPLFDRIGHALLGSSALAPLWTSLTNAPVVPFANLSNTVVLGSLVFWALAYVPILLLAKWAIAKYRVTLYERLRKTRVFKAVTASQLYRVYRLFQPE